MNLLFLRVTQGETWVLSPTIADSTPFWGRQTEFRTQGGEGAPLPATIILPFGAEKTGFEPGYGGAIVRGIEPRPEV